MKKFDLIVTAALLVVVLFIGGNPILHIHYPYLWFCMPFFVIPVVLFLDTRPYFF